MLRSFRAARDSGEIRLQKFMERDHLVVPVVALVEGVIHASNSADAELVLSEEFQRNVRGWNGRPVMLNHPKDKDDSISANDPKVLEQYQIGTVFNARVEDKKLKMDAYLDIEKMEKMGDEAVKMLASIREGKMNEVSVGTFVVAEPRTGKLGDKNYKAVWTEITSDHLAFLPEGIEGACSIEMGCGTRAASVVAAETSQTTTDRRKKMDKKDRIKAIIASGKTCFKEADITTLEALPDERIDELEAHIKEDPEEKPELDPKIKAIVDAAEIEAKKTAEQKREEFLKANPDISDVVTEHKAAMAKKRTGLIDSLKTAQKVYSEAELAALPTAQLEKLVALVPMKREANFEGQVPRQADGSPETVPAPPSMKARILEMRKSS